MIMEHCPILLWGAGRFTGSMRSIPSHFTRGRLCGRGLAQRTPDAELTENSLSSYKLVVALPYSSEFDSVREKKSAVSMESGRSFDCREAAAYRSDEMPKSRYCAGT